MVEVEVLYIGLQQMERVLVFVSSFAMHCELEFSDGVS
jgi:hypothetical protein